MSERQYPEYTGGHGGNMASSTNGKLVPVTTKKQIQKLRANSLPKINSNTMGLPPSNKQDR